MSGNALIDYTRALDGDAALGRALRQHKRECLRCRHADREGARPTRRCAVGAALNRQRAAARRALRLL